MQKFLIVLVSIFISTVVYADQVTLQWDANTEPDLAGYKVYYGVEAGEPYDGQQAVVDTQMFNSPIDVGDITQVTIDMPPGRWYFVVTAYDNETPSLESAYSNEVTAFMAGNPPGAPQNVRIITIP